MATIKKMITYELNPRYFFDSNNDGVGDIQGVIKKLDYFVFLGVDTILLREVMSVTSYDPVNHYLDIAQGIGKMSDMRELIKLAKEKGINVFLELGIRSIKETHKWFTSAVNKEKEYEDIISFLEDNEDQTLEVKFNDETRSYYVFNNKTNEVKLNWNSEKVSKLFQDVIRFWFEQGIKGFVIKEFEYITDVHEREFMGFDTLHELRNFYSLVKEIDEEIVLVGKSDQVENSSLSQLTNGAGQIFDYFLTKKLSKLSSIEKEDISLYKEFNTKDLVKELSELAYSPKNIVAFTSTVSGRVVSKWGDRGQFSEESARSLAIIQFLNPYSTQIYYGDEIGMQNIAIKKLKDFNDKTILWMEKIAISRGIDQEDFKKSQMIQHPLNSRSPLSWNDEVNAGFSKKENLDIPLASNYFETNIKNQFVDKFSTLQTYKTLITLCKNKTFGELISRGDYTIKAKGESVIQISIKNKTRAVEIIANLGPFTQKIRNKVKGKMILSSYSHKIYPLVPKVLEPFETIVIYDTGKFLNAEEDVHHIKELRKIEADIEKTRIINLKKLKVNKESLKKVDAAKVELLTDDDVKSTREVLLDMLEDYDEDDNEYNFTVVTELPAK